MGVANGCGKQEVGELVGGNCVCGYQEVGVVRRSI